MIFVNVNTYKTHYVLSFLDVANSTFSETEANFEAHIKDWFRHGSQRYAREQQKESS